MASAAPTVTTFLNVDIDIRHPSGLKELLDAVEASVIVLHDTALEASFELKQNYKSLEETITAVVDLITSLPPQARKVWDDCELRSVTVGIQAGAEPHAASFALSNEAVAALASARCEIAITVYASQQQ